MASVSYGSKPTSEIALTGAKITTTITSQVVGTVESTLTFAAGTKAFRIKLPESAGAAVLNIATSVGGTASETTRFEISAGNDFREEDLSGAGLTYYITASKDNLNLQIITWS